MSDRPESQSDKIKEAARALETDDEPSHLIEPISRIKAKLESELIALELLAQGLGL
jgi:hypothetical protein